MRIIRIAPTEPGENTKLENQLAASLRWASAAELFFSRVFHSKSREMGLMTSFLFVVAAPSLLIAWSLIVRYGGLLSAALLTLLAGICFGPPFLQFGSLSAERLLVVCLAVTYVILRKLKQTDERPLSLVDVWVGLFFIVLLVSTFSHDWQWEDNLPVARLLFYYALPLVMYFVARQMRVETKDLIVMFYALAVFGTYLALTSIAERSGLSWAIFPTYIVSQEFFEFLGRGRGPLLNPSGNGILLGLGFFSLLMLWPRQERFGKSCILALGLLFAAGLFCTMTRCVWLGAMMGMWLLVWFTFPQRLQRPTWLFSLMIITILAPFTWDKVNRFKRDKNVSISDMSQSVSLRPTLAYVAWQMFKEHPISGVGLGQYKNADTAYLHERSTELVLESARPYHQHNVILSLLTETGLLGVFFFLASHCAWGRSAFLLWKHASLPLVMRQTGLLFLLLQIAYFCNGMFQDVTIVPMVHMTTYFFAGLSVGLYLKNVAAPHDWTYFAEAGEKSKVQALPV